MSVPDPEGYAKHVGEGVMVGEDRHNVPDHLIEKAAEAIHGPSWERRRSFYEAQDLPDLVADERRRQARRALEAVADELRAEGAKAERERIAQEIEAEADNVKDAIGAGYSVPVVPVLREAAARVREGGDTDAQ